MYCHQNLIPQGVLLAPNKPLNSRQPALVPIFYPQISSCLSFSPHIFSFPHVTQSAQLVKAVVYILILDLSSLGSGIHQSRHNQPPCQRCIQCTLCLLLALLRDPGWDQYSPERRETSSHLTCTSGMRKKLDQPLGK